MKSKKQNNNARKYLALFCGCVITVTLSSAIVINARNKNNVSSNMVTTSYANYSFSNVYTYDEVPKYIAVVPELTENARIKQIENKLEENKIAQEEKKKQEELELEKQKQEEEALRKAEEERVRLEQEQKAKEEELRKQEEAKKIVYDNMTMEQLSAQLDKSLNSTVTGYGTTIASYSLEKGVDPYIATAILLHETGCKWNCSELVKKCNNVGGVKGGPTCGSGSYKSYETLDEGIKGYIDNLSRGYFQQGLNTVESIARKYTGFENYTWIEKVNYYINDIKAQ